MSMVVQVFPQCDICSETNPDNLFDSLEEAEEYWGRTDPLVDFHIDIDGTTTCPACYIKEVK